MPRDGPKKKKRPVGRKKKKRGWPGEGGLLYWTPSFLPAPSTQQKNYSEHVHYPEIEPKRTKGNFLLKSSERETNWFLSERVVALTFANQHAYTKGPGTETALSSFSDLMERPVHRGCNSVHSCASFTKRRIHIQKTIKEGEKEHIGFFRLL